jgi:hypothetical protein
VVCLIRVGRGKSPTACFISFVYFVYFVVTVWIPVS